MKWGDAIALVIGIGLVAFFSREAGRHIYESVYGNAPLPVTFVKFAVLATGGEILAYRLRAGHYRFRGFGIVPKMVVWGLLGLAIYAAFGIFSAGVPAVFTRAVVPFFHTPVTTAFLISVFMNVFFAPVMMLTHHVTDLHIARSGGTFPFRGFHMVPLLAGIDWHRMWSFVFLKTIPLFWIPAHTITFLLPPAYRTIFAAALSVALGVFLGIAARRKEPHDG
jgi:hypothetical protein